MQTAHLDYSFGYDMELPITPVSQEMSQELGAQYMLQQPVAAVVAAAAAGGRARSGGSLSGSGRMQYSPVAMGRKRSVDFISHEISNTSGVPLVLGQPPKRRHSQQSLRQHYYHPSPSPSSESDIYYYPSQLVSPTDSYDELIQSASSASFTDILPIEEEQVQHVPLQPGISQPHVLPVAAAAAVQWNPGYMLPSQPPRERPNSDYIYDHDMRYDMRYDRYDRFDSRKTSQSTSGSVSSVSYSDTSRRPSFEASAACASLPGSGSASAPTSNSVAAASPVSPASGFINYTQRDGPKLMTGVAPSGAQKTKQKREAEARRREQERLARY